MPYRSKIQPRCVCCGELIKPKTDARIFGSDEQGRGLFGSGDRAAAAHVTRPKTKEEVRGRIRGATEVKSVAYYTLEGDRRIWKATYWDGESWEDEFFLNQSHAVTYAYKQAQAAKFARSKR